MINAAKKANRKLAIGCRMHYDPNFIEAKLLGQRQAFGSINYIEAALGYSFAPEVDSWKVKKAMGGGSLYNLGENQARKKRLGSKSDKPVECFQD